ncbi:hypothetical protein [Selenomonas sp. KH1T6]|uniref:hypothetical protein n=1 Tax=Selenomonas sp. KH1T6 TaxID=3158784 RepID=UPI0008A7AEAD|nr:hypothetical protein SAMN05216583_12138 [Selenomonas ruminantium]
MKVQNRTVKEWLAHLRCHPIPEIMDETCLEALKSIEAQYGDDISHGAGLEVRLGDEARYVDYIMNLDDDSIPGATNFWYEIDYGEFLKAARQGSTIEPCLFAQMDFDEMQREDFWDSLLPPFLGEERARRLRGTFDHVLEVLPKGAHIKQVGTMTSRGELDIMRIVVFYQCWEDIAPSLGPIGWPGDVEAFRAATEPWKEDHGTAVNFDLAPTGVLPKLGVEVFSRWRHPLLVDKYIARLEKAGLCLPSKAEALRRWIRLRPEGEPFVQTLISYFKLVYKDGRIAEAKAYLEQTPYRNHRYFDAYERPVRLDMELAAGKTVMPKETALSRLRECGETRVGRVRFHGGEAYASLVNLLEECREIGIRAEIVLKENLSRQRLRELVKAGADSFLVESYALWTVRKLCGMGFPKVRVRYFLKAGKLSHMVRAARLMARLGVAEFMVTGEKPCQGKSPSLLGAEEIKEAADLIRELRETMGYHEDEEGEPGKMKISLENCFSHLAAFLGGEDPTKNPNRGIEGGCEAGLSFAALKAEGSFSPCLCMEGGEAWGSLLSYWEESTSLRELRDTANLACKRCCYYRRCRPCPAVRASSECPMYKKKFS